MIVAVCLPAISVCAAQAGFTASLSPENRAAAGLNRLDPKQIAELDTQVRDEIATAREGRTPAFATSFTHRRTPAQRHAAGLDRLMTPELTRLDTLVAAVVAAHPNPSPAAPEHPAAASTPSSDDWTEVTPRRLEVHGRVSMTYLSGSGGLHGYGGSVETTLSDRADHFALSVGVGQFQINRKAGWSPGLCVGAP